MGPESAHALASFPAFRPRPPWWGPDLQTLRNALVPPPELAADKRLELPLDDGTGDALSAALQLPDRDAGRPLVVLIHGLSGTEDSAYMIHSARAHLAEGHPVLRVNLRGAGPSRPLCRLQYHSGRSRDLRDALRALPADLRDRGLLLRGYSLGGNMLLKFLAEFVPELPVIGAVSVSAPIDLAAASHRFLHARNRVYHRQLLRTMKTESLAEGAHVSEDERMAILAARSILEFDELFVAPRNGYRDASEYYADNMARRFLDRIRVPTLVIHALDDPWIPGDAYTSYPWGSNPMLSPLLARGGGHVGFHARDDARPWHDRCAIRWFRALPR